LPLARGELCEGIGRHDAASVCRRAPLIQIDFLLPNP